MWMDNWVLNTRVDHWPKFGAKNAPALFRFFESQTKMVVLSSSNKPEEEVNESVCQEKHIPVLRRKGGGGTVLLGPGCLILTFAFFAKDVFGNSGYFEKINRLWINALAELNIQGLNQQGISDICLCDRKIAGTSIFRKKHLLVYQGSLLVQANIEEIAEVLAHPTREPDYRKGRNHTDFITTLQKNGYHLDMQHLTEHCEKYFNKHLYNVLYEDFFENH